MTEEVTHGRNWFGSDYTLCGFAEEGENGDSATPIYAQPGEIITCPECRQLIMHVYSNYDAKFKVRL